MSLPVWCGRESNPFGGVEMPESRRCEQCGEYSMACSCQSSSLYAVNAVRNGKQLPIFYLDENVNGIINRDHAKGIARDILGEGVNIWVEKV